MLIISNLHVELADENREILKGLSLVVNGFVRDVPQQLPMEFMAETQKLIGISLEGSVG